MLQYYYGMEQMNASKLIQHLRKITLSELFYIYLWEPSDHLRLERRLITDMFLTEGWSKKINYIQIYIKYN